MADHHGHGHGHGHEESNLKTGLLGLAVALVFIAIVMAISHFLAL